ncbi:MAG: hypothetical protein ACLQB1_19835, partial [Streptosporangiaceae bacterium]
MSSASPGGHSAPWGDPRPRWPQTPPHRRWLADLAWLPGQGVRRDVLIEADGERFTSVTPGVTPGVTPASAPPAASSTDTAPSTPSASPAPAAATSASSALPAAEHLAGLTLPGFANAHSHAFHRALRATTQADRGTFWTWRERMYEVAARLDPDSYLRLARAVYA